MKREKSATTEETEARKNKISFYKTFALLGIFILIVTYSLVKKFWTNPVDQKQPDPSSSQKPRASRQAINPLGESQDVRFMDRADHLLISDDGRNIVTFSENEVFVYQVGNQDPVVLKDIPRDLFRSGDFLADDKFVMGGESGAGVWNLRTGEKLLSLKAPGGVETVAASPDSQMIAGVSRDDGRIWLWETMKGNLLKQSTGDKNSFRPSIYFQDNSQLSVYEISESRGRILQVEIPAMKINAGAWQQPSDENSLKFSVNGKWLSGGSSSRDIAEPELLVFDGRTGQEAGKITLGENGSGEMVDNSHAVTIDGSGKVNLVNLSAGNSLLLVDLKGRAELVATSQNGKMAVIKIGEKEALVLPIPAN